MWTGFLVRAYYGPDEPHDVWYEPMFRLPAYSWVFLGADKMCLIFVKSPV